MDAPGHPPSEGALVLVSATRSAQADFVQNAWLARSLRRVATSAPARLRLFAGNTRPLPECCNRALDETADDDVHVDDWMLGQRLQEALQHFDVVGVAGNTRRLPMQLAWHLLPGVADAQGRRVLSECDAAHLSGAVGHGEPARSKVTVFGPALQAVAVHDGVLLAARAGRLRQAGVRFDPQFAFHFYDLDFCRSAQAAGHHPRQRGRQHPVRGLADIGRALCGQMGRLRGQGLGDTTRRDTGKCT